MPVPEIEVKLARAKQLIETGLAAGSLPYRLRVCRMLAGPACEVLEFVYHRYQVDDIQRRGERWCVHPLKWWAEQLETPERTFRRYVKTLCDLGLIERGRHFFKDRKTELWLRPTAKVCELLKPWDREAKMATPGKAKMATHSPVKGQNGHSKNEHSLSEESLTNIPAHTCAGKGKVDSLSERKGKLAGAPLKTPPNPQSPLPPAKFPEIKGPHEPYVKHPAKNKPKAWPNLSDERKAEKYEQYKTYVDNWYAAHPQNKKPLQPSYLSDEEAEADLADNGWIGEVKQFLGENA